MQGKKNRTGMQKLKKNPVPRDLNFLLVMGIYLEGVLQNIFKKEYGTSKRSVSRRPLQFKDMHV